MLFLWHLSLFNLIIQTPIRTCGAEFRVERYQNIVPESDDSLNRITFRFLKLSGYRRIHHQKFHLLHPRLYRKLTGIEIDLQIIIRPKRSLPNNMIFAGKTVMNFLFLSYLAFDVTASGNRLIT